MSVNNKNNSLYINLTQLALHARQHSDNMTRDIKNASTRIEHLRLTTLAFEAERLADTAEKILIEGDHGQ
jgi:hypothetical protein